VHPLAEILSVVAWGMLKMLVAAGLGAGLGFGFLQNFICTAVGGCLGVLIFYGLSERLTERARLRWLRKRNLAIAKGEGKVAPIFTKLNRRIIRIKRTSGYWGIAALTPLVLTIPLGGILAARFFHHERRAIPTMLLSVVVQALCVTAVITGFMGRFTG
jgi:hypothetical protein